MVRKVITMAAALVLLMAPAAVAGTDQGLSYEDYAAVLKDYVNEKGMVDYEKLKEERGRLDSFATEIATLKRAVYEGWNERGKIAFWLNAYNALTLRVIINHYPIKSSFIGALIYPENSIRQIPGVWDEITFPVMGEKMTLNQIEHDTLRADFNEPRIHVALVCAAMGCPPLRTEPYRGAELNEQLDDQTRRFLKNPEKFHIEPVEGRVYLSSIFKWFGEDFIPSYGTDRKFEARGEKERAVLNFISSYVDEKVADFLRTGDYEIKYLDYDWSLNEQKE